jgi:hypothetical protein
MEEHLSQTWIMYCITRFLIILISFDRASWITKRITNQLDADKLRFIDVISSTCFRHHYAHQQEYRSEPTDRLWCTTLVVLCYTCTGLCALVGCEEASSLQV